MAEDIAGTVLGVKKGDDDYFRKGTRLSKTTESGGATDRANRATQDQVLDPRTRLILFRMINRGIFDEFRGCLSTGKEANVYRAVVNAEPHSTQLAVKVYKTAILAFKDRERYVTGEFRFQQGYSRSNPRKMVKLWAEKETRNLKRIYKSDILVPRPLHLNQHVLVMEFLGNEEGYASPKLKDADDIERDEWPDVYRQMVSYMRIMYQECRLVHADLSEYNVLWHQHKLWIIDVSQSVEHDHPRSLDFLRMDIKNVNDFFAKRGVVVFSERTLFKFITTPPSASSPWPEKTAYLVAKLRELPEEAPSATLAEDDAVFRSVYIPRNLSEVYDADRDTERLRDGDHNLIYRDLLGLSLDDSKSDASEGDSESGSEYESGSEQDTDSDVEGEEETDVWIEGWDERHQGPMPRKFADRDANRERKKQVKEDARQKRTTKVKKKDKKKIEAKLKASKKKRKH